MSVLGTVLLTIAVINNKSIEMNSGIKVKNFQSYIFQESIPIKAYISTNWGVGCYPC